MSDQYSSIGRIGRRGFLLGGAGAGAQLLLGPPPPASAAVRRPDRMGGTAAHPRVGAAGSASDLQGLLIAAGASATISGDWVLEQAVTLPKALRTLTLADDCRIIVVGDHAAFIRRGSIALRHALSWGIDRETPQIAVADASPYRRDEYLLLSGTDTLSSSTIRPGYLRKVNRVNASSIDLDRGLPRDITTRPTVASVAMSPSIAISGGGEIFSDNPPATAAPLIDLFAVANPQVSGIRLHDSGGSGIRLEHCYKGTIACEITDLLDDEDLDHFGYGVNVTGSTRELRVEGRIGRVRHAVTTNAGRYITGVGSVGEAEGCVFAPVAFDCTNKALDTHRPGWNILMIPNVTGGVGAVQIRADATRVEGGVISECAGPGISVFPEVAIAATIRGVTIRNLTAPGAALRSTGPCAASDLTIREIYGGPCIELGNDCIVEGSTINGGNPVGVRFLGSHNRAVDLQLGPSVTVPFEEAPGATDNEFSTVPPDDIELLPAPSTLTQTTIAGTAAVGGRLTITPATWNLGGLTVAYDWTRDGEPIEGATARTYRTYDIVADDAGAELRVTMRVSKAGYEPAASASDPTAQVDLGPTLVQSAAPSIDGTGARRTYLFARRGSWTAPPAAKTVAHEWVIDGVRSGITSSSYFINSGDVGKTFAIEVTARRPGYRDGVFLTPGITAYDA